MNEVSHNLLDDVAEILISEERLRERTREVAQEIIRDYKEIDDLLLICVLKGAFMFLADLSRELERPHCLDFMGVSSYGTGTVSSGAVRIVMDLKEDIAGRHVLIVEDIIDSGLTTASLLDYLKKQQPASLKICALTDKPSRRQTPLKIDYLGFNVPDKFLVGYGMDCNEKYRNLPDICFIED